ncbi:hypothetical protein [Fundicoccus ignavus]|uniref:YokE-like PH domain-containing protein n=1 Tax=Fundicoccus ignavus TaxID=2664442 RepID=A0A844C5S9_9LACT|nr:hypothetical protein [Fundicoccus ignavus]MRJ48402.1 hypothetical protein [Fundicoccus ignavus]
MKLTIGKDDVRAIQAKYGGPNAVAGYVEEAKLFNIPLPKYYVMVLDDEKLTLVQMNMSFKEVAVDTVPLSEVTRVKVSGALVKKIVLETNDKTYKLNLKPLALGLGDIQKDLLARIEDLA